MAQQNTILVIDDEPDVVRSLQDLLRLEYRVVGAAGAADALAVLQREEVQVVITDQRMPETSGVELLRRIQGQYPDVVRIVLTGYADISAIIEAINKGNVFRYILKPWDPDELQGVVRQACVTYDLIAERKRLLQDLKAKVGELETANAGLAAAQAELRDVNRTLEQRVAQRTAEAERRTSQIRALAVQLTGAEERERERIAHILHEELQQLLVAARLAVHLGRAAAGEEARLHANDEADALLNRAIQASRSLTAELRPPVLSELGLVPAVEWLAGKMLGQYGLSVRVEADAPPARMDEPFRGFLFEAIRELLFNVVKHSQVREARVQISRSRDNWLRVAVVDCGVGFEPARVGEGDSISGFGLFSIRERLNLLGGLMEIDSAAGQGARIVLRVPQGPPAHQAAPQPLAAHPVGLPGLEALAASNRKIRVLLADDHKMMREGLADLLGRQSDIEVVGQADDGVSAVVLARQTLPDVVVMDVTLPRMSGIEATSRIVSEMPAMRVIGLSMHDEKEIATAMVNAGATAYLTKSGPMEALLAAVRDCWTPS